MCFSIDAVSVTRLLRKSCLSVPIPFRDSSNSGSSCMQYQSGINNFTAPHWTLTYFIKLPPTLGQFSMSQDKLFWGSLLALTFSYNLIPPISIYYLRQEKNIKWCLKQKLKMHFIGWLYSLWHEQTNSDTHY